MSVFKRSIYCIIKNLYSTIITLAVVFILGILVSVLYSTAVFIENNTAIIQEWMRPIVTFVHDYDAMEESWKEAGGFWVEECDDGDVEEVCVMRMMHESYFPLPEQLTTDKLAVILSDPRISSYHIAITIEFETEFLEYLPDGAEGTIFSTCMMMNEITQQCFEHLERNNINIIPLQGNSNDVSLEISEGLIELSQGFSFTDIGSNQIDNRGFPLILSENFATLNNFQLGSVVNLAFNVYDTEGDWTMLDNPTWEDVIDNTLTFEFYIVGLFRVIPDERENLDFPWVEPARQRALENMFFTSYDAIVTTRNMKLEEVDININSNIYLLLNNPLELSDFMQDIMDYLPDYWMINYVSRGYENVAYSLENINQSFGLFLLFITISSILILILVFLYNLNRRQKELGIYLVLGERKSNIYLQIVLETLFITLLSLILSLIPGRIISQEVTNQLIRSELASSMHFSSVIDVAQIGDNHLSELGFDLFLTENVFAGEVGAIYILQSVVVAFLITIGVMIGISLLSVMFFLRQSPKKLLEQEERPN